MLLSVYEVASNVVQRPESKHSKHLFNKEAERHHVWWAEHQRAKTEDRTHRWEMEIDDEGYVSLPKLP